MLSKFIKEGDKIELTDVDDTLRSGTINNEPRVYKSKIASITSEDTIEVFMPIEQQKLILLPIDGEYNVVFYTEAGLYQCFARVIDRYKSNELYLVALEFTSNLRKYQRREYYRFSCALEMCARNLEEEEIHAVENNAKMWLQPNRPIKRSVIVDISGGGIRFMSNQRYEPGSMIYCSYDLVRGADRRKYEVVGKVLDVKEVETRPGTFEHRVQYYNMDDATREEIIKFIFEEERRIRKRS